MSPPGGSARGLRVILLSYWVTEEAGGPGVAAAGFAEGLARLGAQVALVAFSGTSGTWLVDERSAAERGFTLVRTPGGSFGGRASAMLSAVGKLLAEPAGPTVLWANGIWNVQSLIAGIAGARWGVPYVVRPAGSLGHAALERKRLKKLVYYGAIESRVARRAAAVHCMTEKEALELPAGLTQKAFVVPSGVEVPTASGFARDPSLVGVLARLHPIKNHDKVLDAAEALIRRGRELRLEFAGSTSDSAYEASIRRRISSSPWLTSRVRLLGHVGREALPRTVGRWRAAMLLSDQENFGHAVITAAAMGVPTVVSPGVGLADALTAAGAGVVASAAEAGSALERLLARDADETAASCRAFAEQFTWTSCSRKLLDRLLALAHA